MATLLFVAFVVYLYAPFLLFKTFADLGVDMGRRKDSTRVEEFFSAALPSAILNLFAFMAFALLRWADRLNWTRSLAIPGIDWKVASSVIEGDGFKTLATHFGSAPTAELKYLFILALISAANGLVFGQVERRMIKDVSPRRIFAPLWFVARFVRWVWTPMFGDQIVWMSATIMQESYVFVRLRDDRLFYGQLYGQTKMVSHQTEGLVLIDTVRFSREPISTCVRKLKNPLRRLHGAVYLNWQDIVDINFVEPSVMKGLRRGYARQLRQARLERQPAVASLDDFTKLASPSSPSTPPAQTTAGLGDGPPVQH